MSYQLTNEAWVYRMADDAVIVEDSPGWAEYQAWLAAGNTPEPAVGYAPFGVRREYNDADTKWRVVPNGTEEKLNSAIFEQRVNMHRRQYNLRQARKVLLKPLPANPTGKQIQQRLDAKLLISGGT